jgi:hypothetical protein
MSVILVGQVARPPDTLMSDHTGPDLLSTHHMNKKAGLGKSPAGNGPV